MVPTNPADDEDTHRVDELRVQVGVHRGGVQLVARDVHVGGAEAGGQRSLGGAVTGG